MNSKEFDKNSWTPLQTRPNRELENIRVQTRTTQQIVLPQPEIFKTAKKYAKM